MSKIIGVTVGTPTSPSKMEEELKPVKTVNGVAPDENGNVNVAGGSGAMPASDIFRQNMALDYGYDAETGTSYTAIRVYKTKTDGSLQYPFVFAPNGSGTPILSGLGVATNYGFPLTINAGCGGTFGSPNGTLIQNGVVIQQGPTEQHPTALPLTIDNNGDLWYADADADAETMVESGIVSAVCGFMPIIRDYEAVPNTEWPSGIDHYTQQAQRQIIGQYANGDYAIITCEGRGFANSPGWTIAQAQSICISLGLKFAYNLDGGGSTSVVIGKKQLNLIYEGATGRKVPAFIVFNGGTVAPETTVPDEPDIPDEPDEPDKPDAPIELPDGYTLLEYAEVDGRQYANSGIPENTDISVEYAFAPNQGNGINSAGHILSSANIYAPYLRYTADGTRNVIAQRFGNQQKVDYVFADNTKYTIKAYLDGTDDIFVNDSLALKCAKGDATLSASNMLYLFAYGGNPNETRFRASGKFYYMKVYDANGELIRYFVPCANSSAVVGLFDIVNEVFYRSISGVDFIYSGNLPEPDVDEDDTYVYPESINVPRGAYINTGIPETQLYSCEYKAFNADLAYSDSPYTTGHILSSANTYYTFLKRDGALGNAAILGKFKGSQGSERKTIMLVPYVIKTEYDGTTVVSSKDGEVIHTVTVGTTAVESNTFYLFTYGGSPSSENYAFTGTFYYLKLTDISGNLVHNYKPAKRKSDNVYGVLDTVTNVFCGSDTAIAFTGT